VQSSPRDSKRRRIFLVGSHRTRPSPAGGAELVKHEGQLLKGWVSAGLDQNAHFESTSSP